MLKRTTTTIKFFWNGIKVNGGGLIRCYFWDNGDAVTIHAKDYDDLPGDIFDVRNDSDSMTDYFEKDRATLSEDHPLYKYAKHAAQAADIHDKKRHIKYIKDRMAQGWKMYTPKDVAKMERELADLEKAAGKNPGQPTAADLEKIDAIILEREAERKRQEEEEARERRAQFEREAAEKLTILAEAATHPIKEGEPKVLIEWSEHPAFYDWNDTETLWLSLTAADNILKHLDDTMPKHLGYYKTSFIITHNGDTYEGRYDIGDHDGGIVEHIRALAAWDLEHNYPGHETAAARLEYAALLKKYLAA